MNHKWDLLDTHNGTYATRDHAGFDAHSENVLLTKRVDALTSALRLLHDQSETLRSTVNRLTTQLDKLRTYLGDDETFDAIINGETIEEDEDIATQRFSLLELD